MKRNIETALYFCAFMLILLSIGVSIALFISGYCEDAQETQKQEQPAKKEQQQDQQADEDNKSRGWRVDPHGNYTTPGNCIGWVCFGESPL